MEVKILESPPPSGKYEEHFFGESGNTLWVKFVDEYFREWVGIFDQREWNQTKKVLEIPNQPISLIIAGGQGYFVNVNTRKIEAKTSWDNIEDVIYNPTNNCFIISNGLTIAILKNNNITWESDRISVDGIKFTGQHESTIEGILNDMTDNGCEFTFEISKLEISSRWLYNKNIDK